jgi:short-subunit dehydrogenase
MIVVITGASSGIGLAIAERFAKAEQGHVLLLCSKTKNKLEAAAKSLQSKFRTSKILSYAADLSKQTEAEDFAEWCLEHGVPGVLVNNAGHFLPGSVHNEESGTLETMLEINLYSAYHLTRKLLPAMMNKKAGHIINMCSIASLNAYPNGGAYSISKFALAGFSKNLREEMKPHNIKVISVYPGAVMSNSWAGSNIDPKRIMEARDVAEMVFTATQLSSQACVEEIVMRPQLGDL